MQKRADDYFYLPFCKIIDENNSLVRTMVRNLLKGVPYDLLLSKNVEFMGTFGVVQFKAWKVLIFQIWLSPRVIFLGNADKINNSEVFLFLCAWSAVVRNFIYAFERPNIVSLRFCSRSRSLIYFIVISGVV